MSKILYELLFGGNQYSDVAKIFTIEHGLTKLLRQ